jgi:hypothetical protein
MPQSEQPATVLGLPATALGLPATALGPTTSLPSELPKRKCGARRRRESCDCLERTLDLFAEGEPTKRGRSSPRLDAYTGLTNARSTNYGREQPRALGSQSSPRGPRK